MKSNLFNNFSRRFLHQTSSTRSHSYSECLSKKLYSPNKLTAELFCHPSSNTVQSNESVSIKDLRDISPITVYARQDIRENVNNWRSYFISAGIKVADPEELKSMSDTNLYDYYKSLIENWKQIQISKIENFANSNDYEYQTRDIVEELNNVEPSALDCDFLKALGVRRPRNIPVLGLVDRAQLKSAFEGEFEDPIGAFSLFTKQIRKNAKKWDPSSYFAPYTALIQSSGSGKSRYVAEYGNQGWLMYFCLRPHSSSGYPYRTPIIADFLNDPTVAREYLKQNYPLVNFNFDHEKQFAVNFYVSVFAGVLKTLKLDLEEFMLANPDLIPDESVLLHMKSWKNKQFDFKAEDKDTHFFFARLRDNIFGLLAGSIKEKIADPMSKQLLEISSSQLRFQHESLCSFLRMNRINTKTLNPCLFGFDEASYLLQMCDIEKRKRFDSLRYAMNLIPPAGDSDLNLYNVIMDTMGRMANFIPTTEEDPSLRFVKSKKLYEPYIDVLNWNLGLEKHDNEPLTDSVSKKTYYMYCGRPLWRSVPNFDFIDATRLAQLKLTNYSSMEALNNAENGPTAESRLAVISARFGCQLSPLSPISAELSRSHLSVCLSASATDNLFQTTYPSEPMVGLAAQRLMMENPKFSMKNLIETYLEAKQSGIVNTGASGELAANMILAEAFDRACEGDTDKALEGVTVDSFLKSLFAPSFYHKIVSQVNQDVWKKLRSGRVNFTQFTKAHDYTPDLEDMKEWWNRGAVCIGKTGQAGWDAASALSFGKTMSAMVISAKNDSLGRKHHQNATVKSSLFCSGVLDRQKVKLTDKGLAIEDVDIPYLVLSMNVSPGKSYSGGADVYTATPAVLNAFNAELKAAQEKTKKTPRLYFTKVSQGKPVVVAPSKNQVVIGVDGFYETGKAKGIENEIPSINKVYQLSDEVIRLLTKLSDNSADIDISKFGRAQIMWVGVSQKLRQKLFSGQKK